MCPQASECRPCGGHFQCATSGAKLHQSEAKSHNNESNHHHHHHSDHQNVTNHHMNTFSSRRQQPPTATMLLVGCYLILVPLVQLALAALPQTPNYLQRPFTSDAIHYQTNYHGDQLERRTGFPGTQVAISLQRVKNPDLNRKKRFPVMWLRNQYPFNKYYGGGSKKQKGGYSDHGGKYGDAMLGQYSEQVETLDPNPSTWVRIPDRPTASIKLSKQSASSSSLASFRPPQPPPSLAGADYTHHLEPMMAQHHHPHPYYGPSPHHHHPHQMASPFRPPRPHSGMMESESQQSDYSAQPAVEAAAPAQQGFGGISLSFGNGRSLSFGGGQGLTIGTKAGAISIGGKNGDNQQAASAYSDQTANGGAAPAAAAAAPAYSGSASGGGGGGSGSYGGSGGSYDSSYKSKHPTMSMDFPRQGKKLMHVNLDGAPMKIRAHMSPRVKITTGSRDPLEKPGDEEQSENEEDIFEAPEPFEKKNATATTTTPSPTTTNEPNTTTESGGGGGNATDTTPTPFANVYPPTIGGLKYPQQNYNIHHHQQQQQQQHYYHQQQQQQHQQRQVEQVANNQYHFQQQQQQQQSSYLQQRPPVFDEPPHYQRPQPTQFLQQQPYLGPPRAPLAPPVQTYRPTAPSVVQQQQQFAQMPEQQQQPQFVVQQPAPEQQQQVPPQMMQQQPPMMQQQPQPPMMPGGEQQQQPLGDERPAVNQWRQFSGQARQQMSRSVPKQQEMALGDQNPRFYNGGHPNSIVGSGGGPPEGKEMVDVAASSKVGSYSPQPQLPPHLIAAANRPQQQQVVVVQPPMQHPQFGPQTVYQVGAAEAAAVKAPLPPSPPAPPAKLPQAPPAPKQVKPASKPAQLVQAQESNYQPATYGGGKPQHDGTKTYTFGNGGISSHYGSGSSNHPGEGQPGNGVSDGFDQKNYQAKVEKFEPDSHDPRERSKVVFFLKPRISIHMANSSTTTKRPKNMQRFLHVINKPIFLNNTRNKTHEDEDFLDPDLLEPMDLSYGYGYGYGNGGYGGHGGYGYGGNKGGYKNGTTTKKPKPKTTTTTTTTTTASSATDSESTTASSGGDSTTTTSPSTTTSTEESSSTTTTTPSPSSSSTDSSSTDSSSTTTTTTEEPPATSSSPSTTTTTEAEPTTTTTTTTPAPTTTEATLQSSTTTEEPTTTTTTTTTSAPETTTFFDIEEFGGGGSSSVPPPPLEEEADLIGAATESSVLAELASTTTTMRVPMMRRTTRATFASSRAPSTTSTSTTTSTTTTTTTTTTTPAPTTTTEAPTTTTTTEAAEAQPLEMTTTQAPTSQAPQSQPPPTTTTTTPAPATSAPTSVSPTSTSASSSASSSSPTTSDDSEEIVEAQNPRKRSPQVATEKPSKKLQQAQQKQPQKQQQPQQQPMLLNPDLIDKLMGNRTLVGLMSSQLKRVVDTELMGEEEKRRIVRQVFEQMMEDKVDFSMNNVRLAVKTVSSSYRAAAQKQRKRSSDSSSSASSASSTPTGSRRLASGSLTLAARTQVKTAAERFEEFGSRKSWDQSSSKSLPVIETAMKLASKRVGGSSATTSSGSSSNSIKGGRWRADGDSGASNSNKTDASGNPIVVVLLPQEKRA